MADNACCRRGPPAVVLQSSVVRHERGLRHVSPTRGTLMKQPSVYLKMRVLGAVDTVEGRTRHERMHNVAALIFLDVSLSAPN
jgi:hypothetical protein